MSKMPPHEWRRVFTALKRAGCPKPVWQAVYQEYLKSEAWADLRHQIHKCYEGRCVNCNTTKGPMQVHHKRYDRLGDEELYDLWLLCEQCHLLEHGLMSRTRWWTELMDRLFGHIKTQSPPRSEA